MGYFIASGVMLAALAALGIYGLRFQEFTANDRRYAIPAVLMAASVGCQFARIARAVAANALRLDDPIQLALQIAQIALLVIAVLLMLRLRFRGTRV